MKSKVHHKFYFGATILMVISLVAWFSKPIAAAPALTPTGGGTVRYVGPFLNTNLGVGGAVVIDFVAEPTSVSGIVNFTGAPDVGGPLCGAGSFSGARSGNNFSFSFVSNDPDPGCGPYYGITFNVSGFISGNEIVNGNYQVPSLGQGGTFSAKQTIRSDGRFFNSNHSVDGNAHVDLATWPNAFAGYLDFTGDAGEDGYCGANSFTGIPNGNNLSFSFLSSDQDAGCAIVLDKRFNLTAVLSGNSLTNGTYYVPFFDQGGTFYTNGPAQDTTLPGGNVASPTAGATIGNGVHTITANAWDNGGGVGLGHVNFWVKYDGSWHFLSTDPTPPYSAQWQTPAGLNSQLVRFSVDIVDKSGNVATAAGGTLPVNFVESTPGVQENLLPENVRAYLNQRSLSPAGDWKCGAASAAMVLAMNGRIGRDYTSMANTANAIYEYPNYIWQVTGSLRNNGLNASYACRTPNDAWNLIKSEIDAGRPSIILSSRVTAGHYFAVVGYREEGSNRQIITYDPYGAWRGTPGSYDLNSRAWDSYIGRSARYNFDAAWGYSSQYCNNGNGYLITAQPQNGMTSTNTMGGWPIVPDEVSDEPRVTGTYEGIEGMADMKVYLPVVVRP